MDPVDALPAAHGFAGAWTPLNATGVANRIYATADVVLRVATDHPESVSDARTESVAAPAARAAGIRTPRLLAFDDSRALIDRPFSIRERIHGETLGPWHSTLVGRKTSGAIGEELAKLHSRVRTCPDPCGARRVRREQPRAPGFVSGSASSGRSCTMRWTMRSVGLARRSR